MNILLDEENEIISYNLVLPNTNESEHDNNLGCFKWEGAGKMFIILIQ